MRCTNQKGKGNSSREKGGIIDGEVKKSLHCGCVHSFAVVAVASFFIGYKVAVDKNKTSWTKEETETFYATITQINDKNFTVKGIESNDINYRGEFVFLLAEETALEWRGTEIEVSDLAVNDMVSITFAGEIQGTYPARIMNVVKVQLLGEK